MFTFKFDQKKGFVVILPNRFNKNNKSFLFH